MGRLLTIFLSLVGIVVMLGPHVWNVAFPVKNGCLMTFMFPSYKNVAVNSSLSSRYKLYLYREARPIPVEHYVSRQSGVPVLYIPGTLGSYRQVRSFASEAYRLFHGDSEYDQHLKANDMDSSVIGFVMGLPGEVSRVNTLDFFTVDFGDEISAASGALVEQQTEFVVDCVLEILSLYANKFIPRFPNARSRNVLLLGHSVGGLVATLAASHPRLMSRGGGGSDSVPAVHSVITMATPHRPVLLPDSRMASLYESAWKNPMSHVAIASIGGGNRDYLIPSRLALPSPHWAHAAYADTLSTHLAHVEADHVCIVWCNQVVRAVVGSMMDMIDSTTKLPIAKPSVRVKKFAKRLLNREGFRMGFGAKGRYEPPRLKNTTESVALFQKYEAQAVVLEDSPSIITTSKCVLYNISEVNAPTNGITVSLSVPSAKILLRYLSGKIVDASGLLLQSPTIHQDDPRSEVILTDPLIERSFARIQFPDLTQILICPHKVTLKQVHFHVCRSDPRTLTYSSGSPVYVNGCSAMVRATESAVSLSVDFVKSSTVALKKHYATVFAFNAMDTQTRLFHSIESGSEVPIRFDSSSSTANLTIWVIFPALSSHRTVLLKSSTITLLHDSTRTYLPNCIIISACILLIFRDAQKLLLFLSLLGSIMLVPVSFFSSERVFVLSYLLVTSSFFSMLFLGFASAYSSLFHCCRSRSNYAFAVLLVVASIASWRFATPSIAVVLIILCSPLTSSSPLLVALLWHCLPLELLSLASWVKVVQESGYSIAVLDGQSQYPIAAFAVVLSACLSGLIPDMLPSGLLQALTTLGAAGLAWTMMNAELNAIFVVRLVVLAAVLIVSLSSSPEIEKNKRD